MPEEDQTSHEHDELIRAQAEYVGVTAMLKLEVFPGGIPGLYRCAIYSSFDRMPFYISGWDSTFGDAKDEAEHEALRYAGISVADVRWTPEHQAD